MITKKFKDQSVRCVFKDKPLFETDANFEIVVPQFSKADASMEMRQAHTTLDFCNSLTDFLAFGG